MVYLLKKKNLPWSVINILFSFLYFSCLFVLSPAFDTYLVICCWSRLQEQHVAKCLRPITIRGKSFARPTEHFHSIPRFTLSDCYEIHRHTKCACASNAPPFVRLTHSFAQRRMRTTFTKPTFIWLGGGGLFAHADIDTRAPFSHPILWYH